MSRPRGGEWLADEIAALQKAGVDVLVSLLELSEIRELELTAEEACCKAVGITFISFGIKDYGVPESRRDFLTLARQISAQLQTGKSIVIHCRQGIGRSSLLAAAVMVTSGIPADEVFERIALARGRPVPDTIEQRQWLLNVAQTNTNKIPRGPHDL